MGGRGEGDRRNNFGLGDNQVRRAGHVWLSERHTEAWTRGTERIMTWNKDTFPNLSLWLSGLLPMISGKERTKSAGFPPSRTGNGEFVWNPASKFSVDQSSYCSWAGCSGLVTLGRSSPHSGPQCPCKGNRQVPPALTQWSHIPASVLGSSQR